MTTTVLVTGGTGQLGRTLVPQLAGVGRRVRVLTRRKREPAARAWVDEFVGRIASERTGR